MADFGGAAGGGQMLVELDKAAGAGCHYQVGVNGHYVFNQLSGYFFG
jgi:hypothetical protein